MEGLIQLLGIGTTIFLMLYMAFNIDEKKHFLLKLLVLLFSIALLLLLPKTTMDYKNHCNFVVKNQTVSADETFYTYDYLCSTNTAKTTDTFYTSILWFVRCFVTYVGLYFAWEVLKWISSIARGKKDDD